MPPVRRAAGIPLQNGEFAVFQEEADQASELSGVFWCGVELVLELDKSVSILELSSSSRAISLSSCYGFAGLRLHPLLVRDLPLLFFDSQLLALVLQLLHSLLVRNLSLLVFDFFPIELDLSQLVVDDGSPVQQLLRRRLRLR